MLGNEFRLVTNCDLDIGAADVGTFVPWPALFITRPAAIIPFSFSSRGGPLLSTASGRRPCALRVVTPQREFFAMQAR
jgi:hypothetical protein